MRTLLLLCAATLGTGAQTAVEVGPSSSAGNPGESSGVLSPETLLLARIKLHMMETLTRQPNYTCLETVERSHRDGYTRKYQLDDTLRIEVALVDGKEMFAWPGSKQFEDKELRELVPTGTFGNGDFALHARSVFGSGSPTYEARGEEKIGGRDAVRYDFRVPRLVSGYQIQTKDARAIIGYHGSFWVDPQSLDLERLEVIGDDIPPILKLKSLSDRMDYARLKIGEGDFLLPDSSEVVLVDSTDTESRNRLRFTACHQYSGQSVLSFDDPAAEPNAAPGSDPGAAVQPKLEMELPKNQQIALSLLDEIDTETSAIGDPVRAQLHADLKVRGQVILPKGMIFSGRITRLEHHAMFTVVGLMFSDAESPKAHATAELEFDRVAGSMDALTSARAWTPNAPQMEHEALVPVRSGRVKLRRGILFFWRT